MSPQLISQSYLLEFIGVALLTGLIDVLWIFSIKSIEGNKAFQTAIWSALLTLFLAVSTVTYVKDYSLIIAAVLGSFGGAYYTTKYNQWIARS